jgi:hypothetical protein
MPIHRPSSDPNPDRHGKKEEAPKDSPRIAGRAGTSPGRDRGASRPDKGFGASGGKAGRHGPGKK